MKANAPEMVYLGSKQRTDKEIFYVFTTPVENDDIEYIRKDVFVEKACQYLEQNVKIILCGDKRDTDKFVEDFKKYVEE